MSKKGKTRVTQSRSSSGTIKARVTLDECSSRQSEKLNAKNISKTVQSNMKLLKDVSFG